MIELKTLTTHTIIEIIQIKFRTNNHEQTFTDKHSGEKISLKLFHVLEHFSEIAKNLLNFH